MTIPELPTTMRQDTEPGTTTIVTDMRDLLAAAAVSASINTKARPVLRSVYVADGCVVATDSYRLVIIGHGNAADLHKIGKAADGKGFCVPADLIVTVGKFTKSGSVTATTDGATVTLVAAGQTFTADRPDFTIADFPRFGDLLPALDAGVHAEPTWNAGYLADLHKIGKILADRGDVPAVRLLVADELKPSLWYLSGCRHGAGLYLLIPIRRD